MTGSPGHTPSSRAVHSLRTIPSAAGRTRSGAPSWGVWFLNRIAGGLPAAAAACDPASPGVALENRQGPKIDTGDKSVRERHLTITGTRIVFAR